MRVEAWCLCESISQLKQMIGEVKLSVFINSDLSTCFNKQVLKIAQGIITCDVVVVFAVLIVSEHCDNGARHTLSASKGNM